MYRLALIVFLVLLTTKTVISGDSQCFQWASPKNPFQCLTHGNCVWWVAYKRPDIIGFIRGNAGDIWYQRAVDVGFDVGDTAKDGSIAVFSSPGHVAYVEKANSDGSFYVSEMDATGHFGDNVQYATYTPALDPGSYKRINSTGSKGNNSYILRGFIYKRPYVCQSMGSYRLLCWKTSNQNDFCSNGSDWVFIDQESGDYLKVDPSVCPDAKVVISGDDPDAVGGGPPVSGGDNSGDLPDLVVDEQRVENANEVEVSRLRVKEHAKCHMKVKNIGKDTKERFRTNCFLSRGYEVDPKDDLKDLGGNHTNGLKHGDTDKSHDDFNAPEWPGIYNLLVCVDDGNYVKESNEHNNCPDKPDVFEVWSAPEFSVTKIDVPAILYTGQRYQVNVDVVNSGDNFGPMDMTVAYLWDGLPIGYDHVEKHELPGGGTDHEILGEKVPVYIPYDLGKHTISVCANYGNKVPGESNTSNNCSSVSIEVKDPNPPPTGAVERAACSKVVGWAKDENTGDSLKIIVSALDIGTFDEKVLETISANRPRQDKGGNYGFEWTPPSSFRDGKSKRVFFTAVNVPVGTNTVIGTADLSCAPLFDASCGYPGRQDDVDAVPTIPDNTGVVRFNGSRQRLTLRMTDASAVNKRAFWGTFPTFRPEAVTRACYSPDEKGHWGILGSMPSVSCSDGFAARGNGLWTMDILGAPLSGNGTWSFLQDGREYWTDPTFWGMKVDPFGHAKYGLYIENNVDFPDGKTLKGTFGNRHFAGVWLPDGFSSKDLNGKAYFTPNSGPYPGIAGTLACDPNTQRLLFSIPSVPAGSAGVVTFGLNGTAALAWQIPELWVLPRGSVFLPVDGGNRYRLPTQGGTSSITALYDGYTDSNGNRRLAVTTDSFTELQKAFPGLQQETDIQKVVFRKTDNSEKAGEWAVGKYVQKYSLVFDLPPKTKGDAVLYLKSGNKLPMDVGYARFGFGIVADVPGKAFLLP